MYFVSLSAIYEATPTHGPVKKTLLILLSYCTISDYSVSPGCRIPMLNSLLYRRAFQCTFSGQGSYCAGVLELALLVLFYSFVFLSRCWSVDLTQQPHQEEDPGVARVGAGPSWGQWVSQGHQEQCCISENRMESMKLRHHS